MWRKRARPMHDPIWALYWMNSSEKMMQLIISYETNAVNQISKRQQIRSISINAVNLMENYRIIQLSIFTWFMRTALPDADGFEQKFKNLSSSKNVGVWNFNEFFAICFSRFLLLNESVQIKLNYLRWMNFQSNLQKNVDCADLLSKALTFSAGNFVNSC